MPRTISFINYKGGVGKTSCIVNTAACIASRGKRVLLFDLDTQSNSSIWLLRLERWNKINTTGNGAVYSIFNPGTERLKDCVVKDVVVNKEGQCLLPGLDIVPTTFNLVDLDQEYEPKPGHPPYLIFHEQLEEIQDDYDFIFFDCPPNILRASQCGIFSSSEVYVPAQPDALSLIGFTLLVSKLSKFNARAASFRKSGMGPAATICGVIMNGIKQDLDIKVPKMRLQFSLNQYRTQKKIHPRAKIFPAEIRDDVVVRRAVTLGLPVSLVGQAQHEEDGVLQDYQNLASQIIRQGDMLDA